MPRYFYKCKYCDVQIDAYHGMTEEERIKDCEYCNSINCMIRIPTKFKTEIKHASTQTGEVVRKAIEDFSNDLQEQKKSLKEEYYEDST